MSYNIKLNLFIAALIRKSSFLNNEQNQTTTLLVGHITTSCQWALNWIIIRYELHKYSLQGYHKFYLVIQISF